MDLSEVAGGRAAVLQVKRQSLMDLAKLCGWIIERRKDDGPSEEERLRKLTPEQRAEEMAQLMQQAREVLAWARPRVEPRDDEGQSSATVVTSVPRGTRSSGRSRRGHAWRLPACGTPCVMIPETVGEDWALFLKEQRADQLPNLLPVERCAGEAAPKLALSSAPGRNAAIMRRRAACSQ
jgi:hypothetical protein